MSVSIETLRTQLRRDSKFKDKKLSDPELDGLLMSALYEYDPSLQGDFSLVPSAHSDLIVLLAWEKGCLTLASQIADEASVSARNPNSFGQDRDSPHAKLLKMAEALRHRYLLMRDALQVKQASAVTGGRFYYKNSITDSYTSTLDPLISGSMLTVVSIEEGECVLRWTQNVDTTFHSYVLVKSNNPNIRQEWDFNTALGIPQIASSAALVFDANDRKKIAVKVTGLLNETPYYFLLITRSDRKKYAYSNEVAVMFTPEPEPEPEPEP